MIQAIIFSLLILLLFAYFSLGKNFSRPSILYIGGFFICSLVAYSWRYEWDLDLLSSTTAFVIVGGAIVFFVVELIIYKLYPQKGKIINLSFDKDFRFIDNWKLILFLLFQLVSFYLFARAKMAYVGTESLADALVEINNASKFENELVVIPFIYRTPYEFCRTVGYIWCVLLPYYQFKSVKYNRQKQLLLLNLLTCIGGVLLSGGRTGILNYIGAYLVFYYICYQFQVKWKGGLFSKKIMFSIIILGLAFSMMFQQIGYAMGREENNYGVNEIFAIYCGAQIKNFDDYIRYPYSQGNESGYWGQYTFSSFYNRLAQFLQGSTQSRQFSTDLSFNRYGNYMLGNVYSCYYNYYADFGRAGILCAGLMSLIFSVVYRKMIQSSFWETGYLNLWICYFSFIIVKSFLCFFSNQYFGSFSIQSFVKDLLYWYVMIIFLQGFRYYKLLIESDGAGKLKITKTKI